ncbi:MAG: hypothetical protein GTN82_43085, partial [Candidatus Aminicenantes bacterium]|nr:hypothetical protein [Candidatus Aminicenantes bacterium]
PENATEYLVKPRSGDRIKVDEGQNQIEFLACLPEDLPQILPQCMEEIDMSIIDVDMLFQKYDTWLNQTVEQLKRGIKFNINVSWDDETQELPIFIYLKEKKEEEFIPPPGIEIYLIAGIIIIIIIVSVYFLVPTKEGGR